MKISIITVCRNAENLIETAIKSVVSQTYQNIEYIIIDGDSQDQTKEIISRYSGFISKFVSEPDSGVYEAMNKGIHLASGSFIYFLNSDDALADEHLVQDVVQFLIENSECDFVYGNLLFQVDTPSGQYTQLITFPDPEGIAEHLVCDCLLHQASFARTDLFSRLGYFNENYRIGSDYEWFLRLIGDRSIQLRYYPRTIASYNAGGMSSDMEKTLSEMFEIQNKSDLYKDIIWLQKRIERYQKILISPQGQFGLHRPTSDQLNTQSNQTELEEKNRQLALKVDRLEAREQELKQELGQAESVIEAMKTSKFWKMRQSWFHLKKLTGLTGATD
jgi:GT2 family glycosyltransferase